MGLKKMTGLVHSRHGHEVCHNRRDMKVLKLSCLRRVAGRAKALHLFQPGPPQSFPQVGKGRQNSLVAQCLESLGDDVEMILLWDDDLMVCLNISAHEPPIQNKEFGGISSKPS